MAAAAAPGLPGVAVAEGGRAVESCGAPAERRQSHGVPVAAAAGVHPDGGVPGAGRLRQPPCMCTGA